MELSRILLINDRSVLLCTIAKLLESKGFKARLTDTTEEALERLSAGFFHLVILKLHRGQIDRLALLHMIKELCPGAKLIIMTDQTPLPLDAYEVEVDDCIIMPCRSSDLWRRIFRCLNGTTDKPIPSPSEKGSNTISRQNYHKLGLMFHDIRGSMVSITAGMKLLVRRSKGRLGDESDRLLEATLNRMNTLISNTEDFLTSCFSSEENLTTKHNYIDLNKDIVDPILDELRDDLLNHHINVVNHLDVSPPHPASVQGDRVALKSAFRNLLTNAIKHGGEGCTINIGIENDGSNYQLQVYNTGPSILQKSRVTLFSKPMLSANINNKGEKGLGLGLYLSREIVRSCGGDVFYKPSQAGSKFILTFPTG
jgi:DNA-binding response OmpR family regulator